jgi:AcrR family transcriptional regulator
MTRHLPEDVRRRQILDAARKCFIEKGYFPTRMEDIAEEAKLSKGGIYFHFESKRQIFEALVRQEYEESAAFVADMSKTGGNYQELIANLARHYIEFFRNRPDYPRFFMVMGEMAGRDPSVRSMLAQLQAEYTRVISGFLKSGIESGALRPIDPEATATVLKGIIDAIEGYMAIGVEMDTERILAAGMQILSQGILARS